MTKSTGKRRVPNPPCFRGARAKQLRAAMKRLVADRERRDKAKAPKDDGGR